MATTNVSTDNATVASRALTPLFALVTDVVVPCISQVCSALAATGLTSQQMARFGQTPNLLESLCNSDAIAGMELLLAIAKKISADPAMKLSFYCAQNEVYAFSCRTQKTRSLRLKPVGGRIIRLCQKCRLERIHF